MTDEIPATKCRGRNWRCPDNADAEPGMKRCRACADHLRALWRQNKRESRAAADLPRASCRLCTWPALDGDLCPAHAFAERWGVEAVL